MVGQKGKSQQRLTAGSQGRTEMVAERSLSQDAGIINGQFAAVLVGVGIDKLGE